VTSPKKSSAAKMRGWDNDEHAETRGLDKMVRFWAQQGRRMRLTHPRSPAGRLGSRRTEKKIKTHQRSCLWAPQTLNAAAPSTTPPKNLKSGVVRQGRIRASRWGLKKRGGGSSGGRRRQRNGGQGRAGAGFSSHVTVRIGGRPNACGNIDSCLPLTL
jgi:hypothetical protein